MATTNFGWTTPVVGASSGAWGTLLNALAEAIDNALFAVQTTANAALSRAGGVLTGLLTLKTAAQTRLDLGAISGARALDLSAAQYYTATITAPTTFTVTNTPAGTVVSGIILRLTNAGAFAITWPTGTVWPGGSSPALTAAGIDVVVLLTDDAGVTWRGVVSMKDVR